MKYFLLLFLFVTLISFGEASACDPCAIYNASRLQGFSEGAFTVSVSEQFTDFDESSDSKKDSIKDGEIVRDFSTTQFSFAYDISEHFGLQATVPVLGRRFQEVDHYRRSYDSDSGIGDVSLIGTYSVVNCIEQNWAIIAGFTGGIKFPTGDTGVLEEVASEEEETLHLDKSVLRHHSIGSTSGGRALAFGTGSYDYIMGISFLSRYERYIFLSYAQYTIRTEGDFDYEFDDDFLWSVGPGYYFVLNDHYSIAGLAALTGEFKGEDHLDGKAVEGSKVSNLFLGPEILFTFGDNFSGELAVDFRVTNEDDDATIVPEVRVRTGLSYRFS